MYLEGPCHLPQISKCRQGQSTKKPQNTNNPTDLSLNHAFRTTSSTHCMLPFSPSDFQIATNYNPTEARSSANCASVRSIAVCRIIIMKFDAISDQQGSRTVAASGKTWSWIRSTDSSVMASRVWPRIRWHWPLGQLCKTRPRKYTSAPMADCELKKSCDMGCVLCVLGGRVCRSGSMFSSIWGIS